MVKIEIPNHQAYSYWGFTEDPPKGTDFDEVSDEELAKIEHILNTRGRESLGFYSPYDIFMQHLNAA